MHSKITLFSFEWTKVVDMSRLCLAKADVAKQSLLFYDECAI